LTLRTNNETSIQPLEEKPKKNNKNRFSLKEKRTLSKLLSNSILSVKSDLSVFHEESKYESSIEEEKEDFTILIIDDNDFNIYTLSLMLETNFNLSS